jgi:hypothetical protein
MDHLAAGFLLANYVAHGVNIEKVNSSFRRTNLLLISLMSFLEPGLQAAVYVRRDWGHGLPNK